MKRKTLALLAAGALLTGLSIGPAVTQESTTAPDDLSETYGSWILRCGADRTGCHVFQSLFRAEDNAKLLQVTLLPANDGEEALVLRALTPLGAVLADGAALEIDEIEAPTAPFLTCLRRGCIAETPLVPELEAAMRGGETLAVSVVGTENGRTVRFELSLDGITRALDRLRGL